MVVGDKGRGLRVLGGWRVRGPTKDAQSKPINICEVTEA